MSGQCFSREGSMSILNREEIMALGENTRNMF
jgi:hypothetical protein